MFSYSNCPVCGAKTFQSFLNCKDYTVSNERFNIVNCNDCGFKFTNPIPDKELIGSYYLSEDYISHSDTKKGLISKLYHLVRNYTIKQKLKLVTENALGKKILDYGCGTGAFLKACRKNGWETFGLEPDSGARKIAGETGIEVSSNLESLKYSLKGSKLDIITLWHVLEHITGLNETINFLTNALSDKGVLIVAVPNYQSYDANHYQEYWAAYDLPRHLYHFDRDSINKLFDNHGYKINQIIPMKFDSYYVSLLSEKYMRGEANHFSAFMQGLKSNLKARYSGNYSSLIYVLKKK